ncbi:MAG: hypothetical protein V1645_00200 [archaeon]
MLPEVSETVMFEVGKYKRVDSPTGYHYIAYPTDGIGFGKSGVKGNDIQRLFGKILDLKEKYGFKRAEFQNKADDKKIPPIEALEFDEMGLLEKLANSPVMRS